MGSVGGSRLVTGRGRWRSQDGSLPMVLLVTIVVAGLIAVVFLDVRVGIRTAAHDRDFNAAVQAADAGIQDAFLELATIETEDLDTVPIGGVLERDGDIDSGSYQWEAFRRSPNQWEVRSEGTVNDVTRVVEANIGPDELFPMAAFADSHLHLTGGNSAKSYDENGVPGAMLGSVGSNTSIVLSGGNTAVDRVYLYATDDYQQSSSTVRMDDGIFNVPERAYFPNVAEEAYADGGVCDDPAKQPYQSWNGDFELERGETYCFLDVEFPRGTTNLQGDSDEPTKIYIHPSNDLHFQGHGSDGAVVNMDPLSAAGFPDATALQIYVASGSVSAGPHTVVAAGVFAPTSTCSGPNAQSEFYGALVCGSMLNAGQWDFYYDERFLDVYSEDFSISNWREEGRNTTSFLSSVD